MESSELRPHGHYTEAILRLGNLILNLDQRQAFVERNLLTLSKSEYAILEILLRRRGVVSASTIIQQTRSYTDSFRSHALGPTAKSINERLKFLNCNTCIRIMPGTGYMLVPPAIARDDTR
jgi:DNA-binding response OmpR family regulator